MGFKINRVYTKRGDKGKTSLVGGEETSKASLRVSAYGELDEANVAVGALRDLISTKQQKLAAELLVIQHDLFDLGAELACQASQAFPGMALIDAKDVTRLEELCDFYGAGLTELTSFIIPGGSPAGNAAHLARVVTRRAERTVTALLDSGEIVRFEAIQYLNRLSDLFFILVRFLLKSENVPEVLWVKKGERG